MSVDTIEASVQDSEPREIVDIVHGATTYRITFGGRDVAHGGSVYTAISGARGEIGPSASGNGKEMTLTLPIDHAFVRRYLKYGNPPKSTVVTLRRKFMPSGDIETRWVGEISSMSCDDDNTEAAFSVESTMSKHLLRTVPAPTVGRDCQHVLYDTMCSADGGVSRTGTNPDGVAYKCTTTVLYVDGREVRIDLSTVSASYAQRATWLRNGELVHVASGEPMVIRKQTDTSPGVGTVTTLTLLAAMPDLKVGDSVDVYAGCNLALSECATKFGNRHRFGGMPLLPNKNPHSVEMTGTNGVT